MFNEKDCWRTKGMFKCNLIKGLLSNNFQIIKAVFWRIAFTIQNHIRFQLIFRLIIIIPLIPYFGYLSPALTTQQKATLFFVIFCYALRLTLSIL